MLGLMGLWVHLMLLHMGMVHTRPVPIPMEQEWFAPIARGGNWE
jgi:hypothetical protein